MPQDPEEDQEPKTCINKKRKDAPGFDSAESKSFFEGLASACYAVPRVQADLSVD